MKSTDSSKENNCLLGGQQGETDFISNNLNVLPIQQNLTEGNAF